MIYKKNKIGLSIMIGYVLLITAAIVMGLILYNWMKLYVPRDPIECSDGTSIFVKSVDCTDLQLNLELSNNGRFNLGGYFIHATNVTGQELATIDISAYTPLGVGKKGMVVFEEKGENTFKPNYKGSHTFNLPHEINSIEIIPIRWEIENNKQRLVSCGNAKVKEFVSCVGEVVEEDCVPESVEETCGTWQCGSKLNNCEDIIACGECPNPDTEYCDTSTGICESSVGVCTVDDNCDLDNGENCMTCELDCGDCCGGLNNDFDGDGEICDETIGETCGHTDTAPECNSDCGACPILCGDGDCDEVGGETCGNTDTPPECNSDCGKCPLVCGNNIVESTIGETCDSGIGSETCEGVLGFGWKGILNCYSPGHDSECTFDVGGCFNQIEYASFEQGSQGWSVYPTYSRVIMEGVEDSPNSKCDIYNCEGTGEYIINIQDDKIGSRIHKEFNFVGYDLVKINFWSYEHFTAKDTHVLLTCDDNEIWRQKYQEYSGWNYFEEEITNADCEFDENVILEFTGDPGLVNTNDDFYIDGINITGHSS